MKKTMMALLALTITMGSMAQPGQMNGPKGQKPPHGMQGMQKLNLTPQQQEQAKKLQEQFRNQMEELDKNESITVKEQRDRRDKLMREHRQSMQNLLTPEQKKQMEQERESARKIAEYKSGIQLEQMKTKLNLTDQQVSAVKTHREKTMKQMQTIRDNEGLSRTARQEQMEKLHTQAKAEMEKILTKEQLQQWQEMRQPRGAQGGMRGGMRGGMHEPMHPCMGK